MIRCITSVGSLGCLLLALVAFPGPAAGQDPLDWTYWRGPQGTGISYETGLVDTWDPAGENLLWKNNELGTRSTPIHMNGKLYTLARKNPGTVTEAERVVCVDPANGNVLWEHVFNVYLSDVPDTRVAWSCVVGDPETGNVYALGVCGYFCCLNGETGEVVWDLSLNEEYGLVSTYGGRTNKPIIFEDTVLISAVITSWGDYAVPAHRFLSFDKTNGELRWFRGTRTNPYDTTYSSPAISVLNGQAALVFGAGDGGVWALQPRTGQEIWHYDLARRGLNVAPLIDGDTIYMNHGEENMGDATMGAVVAINGALSGDVTQSGEMWRIKERVAGRSSPLLIDGKLYLMDDAAALWIIDPKTGKQIVYENGQAVEGDGRRPNKKLGTSMFSNPIYADGKIFAITTNGRCYILQPTAENKEGVKVLSQARLEGEVNGSPIISHGKLFIPTSECMYCVGQADAQPQATEMPELAKETAGDSTPTQLQVVPYEALIQPGESVNFRVRLFNAKGQFLKETPAEFTLEGPGTIDAAGKLTSNADATHSAVMITAKAEGLEGKARVRIVPPLPWKFDFEDGQIPISWVGMRNRHIVEKMSDGNQVAFKRDVIPTPRGDTKLGTRSQGWMGPINLSDYTVQADVMANEKDGWMPIMGVTAQRYMLELMAEEGKIRISTWPAQLRMAKETPYSVKPGVWYTIKLKAHTEGGKAILQAKVWPRDEAEPSDWMLTAEDPSPNLQGAPGFVGNSQYSPFYMDNVSVTPND